MKPKVDDLDRAIVAILQEDGRAPCTEISRRLGYVSARTVRHRIKKLVEKGMIKVTAIPNPNALGYGITADITIEVEPLTVKEVAAALTGLDLVSYVAMVAGDRDVSIQINATDIQDLQTFITETLHAISGVQRTNTFVLLQVLKQNFDWRIPAALQ